MKYKLVQVLEYDAGNVEAIACQGSYHFYSDQPEIAMIYFRRILQMGMPLCGLLHSSCCGKHCRQLQLGNIQFNPKQFLTLWTVSVFHATSDAFGGSLANRSLRGCSAAHSLHALSKCHHVLQVSTAQSSGTTLLYAASMLRNMTWH